jgi:hypothetical protein
VAQLELQSGARRERLELHDGFFLATLPGVASAELPSAGGPYALTSFNAAGKEIARLDLVQVVMRATPPDGG